LTPQDGGAGRPMFCYLPKSFDKKKTIFKATAADRRDAQPIAYDVRFCWLLVRHNYLISAHPNNVDLYTWFLDCSRLLNRTVFVTARSWVTDDSSGLTFNGIIPASNISQQTAQ